MIEEENKEEILETETESTPTEEVNDEQQQLNVDESGDQAPQEEKPKEEKDPQDSFKDLREQKTQAERERDEAYYYINYVLKQSKQAPQEEKPKEDVFDLNTVPDDDLVQADQLKKYSNQQQKTIEQIKKQNDEFIAEYRLNQEYKDFSSVLTKENVAALAKKNPYLAQRLNEDPDIYRKAKETYKFIKELGLYKEDTQSNYNKERIEENSKKPKDSTAAGSQQSHKALDYAHGFSNHLTKEDKKRMRAIVEEKIRRGIRGK